MQNNLKKIELFFNEENKKNLAISIVNEEVFTFYEHVIIFFAKKAGFQIKKNYKNSNNFTSNDDLFVQEKVNFYDLTNKKNIIEIQNNGQKNIFFTDYKNIKMCFNKEDTINGFGFISDINEFLSSYYLIKNQKLIDIISNNPSLLYSEVSKFFLNDKTIDNLFIENTNGDDLMKLRFDYYKLKKSHTNSLVDLFYLLKKEVLVKKFSFLIS